MNLAVVWFRPSLLSVKSYGTSFLTSASECICLLFSTSAYRCSWILFWYCRCTNCTRLCVRLLHTQFEGIKWKLPWLVALDLTWWIDVCLWPVPNSAGARALEHDSDWTCSAESHPTRHVTATPRLRQIHAQGDHVSSMYWSERSSQRGIQPPAGGTCSGPNRQRVAEIQQLPAPVNKFVDSM